MKLQQAMSDSMSRRRQKLPSIEATVQIEKLSHDGRGIARVDGKTTFIEGALPNETVVFQTTRRKADFDEGRVVEVIHASPDRVEPRCPHYSVCGGCSLQHLDSTAQIHAKQALLLDSLARIGHCQPKNVLPPLTAQSWHYRDKARLSVRTVAKKQTTLVGFREKANPRYITEMTQCPILNQRVEAELPALRALIASFDAPDSIAQIEVAVGEKGALDDVILIFRHLSPLSASDGLHLEQFSQKTGFQIFLQSGGPDTVRLFYPPSAPGYLEYSLPDFSIHFKFYPTDFTQVNRSLNQQMVKLALALCELTPEDRVLDLFCGLGNFSLPLARHSASVVGVEGSETMVERARQNAVLNGLQNTEFVAANLESDEVVSELKRFSCNKLLLDPPRTGAQVLVKQINQLAMERIVYVSCNPATLARDADILVNQNGYHFLAAGVMDMFPHTSHVESIAVFVK